MQAAEIQDDWLTGTETIGITSGASTPEALVENVVGEIFRRFPNSKIEILETVQERVEFKPPRELINLAMARSSNP